ncbi:universal stress protein [Pseudonocardia sp.]|uniref:universal stress protein n=1 Tax=Pseudonocardia sp. TaxID=60912 RepID=UPI00345C79A2
MAGAPASWTYHASHGDPVALLAAVAAEHDALMIIVGTRGEGFGAAVARLLGRSVSHGVIGGQHRPVLVVPPPDDAPLSRPEPPPPHSGGSRPAWRGTPRCSGTAHPGR